MEWKYDFTLKKKKTALLCYRRKWLKNGCKLKCFSGTMKLG